MVTDTLSPSQDAPSWASADSELQQLWRLRRDSTWWRPAAIYVVLGLAWIWATDLLAAYQTGDFAAIAVAKGSFFVLFTGGVLAIVLRRAHQQQLRTQARIDELTAAHRSGFQGHGLVHLLVDAETHRIVDANGAAARFYGWSVTQLRAMTLAELNILTSEQVTTAVETAERSGRNYFCLRHRKASGTVHDVEVHSHLVDFEGRQLLYWVIIPVDWRSELAATRDRHEQELLRSRQLVQQQKAFLDSIVAGVNDAVLAFDQQMRVRFANDAALALLGRQRRTMLGQTWSEMGFAADPMPEVTSQVCEVLAGAAPANGEAEFDFPVGRRRCGFNVRRISAIPDCGAGAMVTLVDLTALLDARDDARRNARVLRAAVGALQAMASAQTEQQLCEGVCRALVDTAGFRAAWIGAVPEVPSDPVGLIAHAGEGFEAFATAVVTWDDSPTGRGPTGTAIRTGSTSIVENTQVDATCAPWSDIVAQYGASRVVVIPMRWAARVRGVLWLSSDPVDGQAGEETTVLELIAAEIGRAIAAWDARERYEEAEGGRQDALARIDHTLMQTVAALSSAVEARDPYTSGHQKSVAELSIAIARRLGWSAARIRALDIAAQLHDIGKIAVPADLLTKPSRLSAAERSLIEEHAARGAEILGGIAFGAPIAQIVRQHHERLDGSGYPDRLTGDEILPEARIIGIADTVEAMCSHRPYRAGLGIEAALAELEAMRGTAFDADVVDACRWLFQEGGFSWSVPDA